MEAITSAVGWLNGVVWGPPMLILILGVGLYLTFGLKLLTILKIPFGFGLLAKGRIPSGKGEITPFNALMTSLAATIGTGNIAGVATAIFLGGPGAVFWMWMTALVGMATKYAEAVLAVRYREEDERGKFVGGPMYYIQNGLGKKWKWLAVAFALFAGIAGFGIGNMVQANSVADAMNATFAIPKWITGVVLVALVGAVLLGGIQRIATVAGKLVPLMAVGYIAAGSLILIMHIPEIPAAFGLIQAQPAAKPKATQPARQMPAGQSPCLRYQLSRPSGATSARMVSVFRRGPFARITPLPSMKAEKPVLAAISRGLRHSTARNTPQARCMSSSLEPRNQPSLVRFTSTSGSLPSAFRELTCRRITWGITVS